MKQVKMDLILNNKEIQGEITKIIENMDIGDCFSISFSADSFLQCICLNKDNLGFFRIEKPSTKEGFIFSSYSSKSSCVKALNKFAKREEYRVIKSWEEGKISEFDIQEEINLFNK